MNLEKGRISGSQLMFAVFCFLQAAVLRIVFISVITGNDTWAMVITGFIVCLPLVWVMSRLIKWFPGKNLVEINNIIFGPVVGRIYSLLYLFFFLSIAGHNTRDVGNFTIGFLMPETPISAVLVLFIFVCVYSVRKGVENFIRISAVLSIITVVFLLLNFALILKDAKFDFLLPMFSQPLIKYVHGTHTMATLPYGGIITFLMFAHAVKEKTKTGKFIFLGLLMTMVFMVVFIIRDTITVGPLTQYMTLPSFESVRFINVANILTRMEILYGILMISLVFFAVCISLYAIVLGLAQVFKLGDYKILAYVAGAFVVCYGILVFDNPMENGMWASETAPFVYIIFEYIMPAVSLLVARLRRLNKQPEANKA